MTTKQNCCADLALSPVELCSDTQQNYVF